MGNKHIVFININKYSECNRIRYPLYYYIICNMHKINCKINYKRRA